MSYQELNKMVHDMGHAPSGLLRRLPRSRLHADPRDPSGLHRRHPARWPSPMPRCRISRRYSTGVQGPRDAPYDPNVDATRTEMRSFVCGQCHVEYYCSSAMPLTFPWGNGLKMEDSKSTGTRPKFPNGDRFYDYKHKESGAEILKAQHPEFELWSQGIHARSGVACADCHMPYMRDGASKVSDHWVRSPLLNINRACQTCHHFSEEEILARVDAIQQNKL